MGGLAPPSMSNPLAAFNINGLIAAQLGVYGGTKPPSRLHDDMLFVTSPYYTGGTTGTVTAANLVTFPTGAGVGAVQLSTAAGATNTATIFHAYNGFLGRHTSFRGRVGFWLPNLSDGTDTYTAYVGAWSTIGASPSRQCIYLKYTHGTNSGKFQVLTNNGGTTTDTGVTVAANTFYVFDWTVTVSAANTATNPVTWTLYSGAGVVVATGAGVVTAATSSGASMECAALGAGIVKSLGTAARLMQVDYWEFVGLY